MEHIHYKAITRRYRPQYFRDVFGQTALITTLRNALKDQKVSHAYLFTGSRGTGTTLARLLAKALNCKNVTHESEPCNQCSSCLEIMQGCSLDVIEIDGASHRGIDDIRQINETISFTPVNTFKIYIIDEVHMLTKEAFNALLKTLEEPPPQVKFFFATTEPHKVPATITSRCQRFNLRRITEHDIVEKMKTITTDLSIEIDITALHLIAKSADGSLRDAESLLDQILSFQHTPITLKATQDILGIPDKSLFFKLDQEASQQNFLFAYELTNLIYSSGKHFSHFIDGLIEHFRMLLTVILTPIDSPSLLLPTEEKEQYMASSKLYSKEQILDILNHLLQVQKELKVTTSPQVTVELALLFIIRSHALIPVDLIIKKLQALETTLHTPTPLKSIQETHSSRSELPNKITPSQPSEQHVQKPLANEPNLDRKTKSQHDTLMRFAAVELQGILKKT